MTICDIKIYDTKPDDRKGEERETIRGLLYIQAMPLMQAIDRNHINYRIIAIKKMDE